MTNQTSAIVFEDKGKAVLKTIDLPEPAADELLLRMTVSGVSVGTERWALLGRRPEMKFPFVTGYLGVGVVEQAGAKVKDFQPGDRVFTTAARQAEPFRSNSWLGTHAARAVVPATTNGEWPPYVCKIPDGVDDVSAAMAGLASVSVQGADMLRVSKGDVALVIGLGMIGQASAQVLRARGARVIAADMLPLRVEAALKTGCDAAICLDSQRPLRDQLAKFLPEGGADIVVEATAAPPVILQLASLIKVRGQILLQAYYPGQTAFDLDALHGRRPTIHVACAFDVKSHRHVHQLIEAGQMKLKPLVTHEAPAKQAPEIYQMVLEKPDEFLGIVFHWD